MRNGILYDLNDKSALDDTPEQRECTYTETSSPDFNHLPHLTETTARPLAPHPRHRTRV
jgi:hypothetical protein